MTRDVLDGLDGETRGSDDRSGHLPRICHAARRWRTADLHRRTSGVRSHELEVMRLLAEIEALISEVVP